MSNDPTSINELTIHYGYVYKGACNCDGYETHKWSNVTTGREIHWRKYKQTVAIFRHRRFERTWFNITELKKTLDVLEPQKTTIVSNR